jgi:hypothetical protein
MVALDGNVNVYEMECNRMLQYNILVTDSGEKNQLLVR